MGILRILVLVLPLFTLGCSAMDDIQYISSEDIRLLADNDRQGYTLFYQGSREGRDYFVKRTVISHSDHVFKEAKVKNSLFWTESSELPVLERVPYSCKLRIPVVEVFITERDRIFEKSLVNSIDSSLSEALPKLPLYSPAKVFVLDEYNQVILRDQRGVVSFFIQKTVDHPVEQVLFFERPGVLDKETEQYVNRIASEKIIGIVYHRRDGQGFNWGMTGTP